MAAAPAPAVILVRPQLGENVGTAARAMQNFGLDDLRLVRPQCGWPNVKALNAASGATGVLNRVQVFETVRAATAGLHRLYATTARARDLGKPVLPPAAAMGAARAALARGEGVGVLFGPERTGLENDDLALADAIVRVPVNPGFFSLNLAQAVLLLAYEWFQSSAAPPAAGDRPRAAPATKEQLAQLLDHLVAELDDAAFFRSADQRASMVPALRAIFARAALGEGDVHLLRGVVKSLARGRRQRRGCD